ncbi:MAG: tRNA guanosine(34) transglycosylase Tgt [Deltaproteobacteria bacterium]|nr:tRNA guanosine(34) transglycosylase Tgt [Deltaproteobacteria bacterium]
MFKIQNQCGRARSGVIETTRGTIRTPIFMPVGTYGSVKSVHPSSLKKLDAEIILGNTFHLHERPGEDFIEEFDSLHGFMRWEKPILTDSGGFQVFSLARLADINDDGVSFKSPVDGSNRFFNPEVAMGIQKKLGSDIAMAFDQCPPGDADRKTIESAMRRTTAWAARCSTYEMKPWQAKFGIFQGGIYEDLRKSHMEEIAALDFDGLAIGGLSVGEPIPDMYRILESVVHLMPHQKPRYLMGVGTPIDIVTGVLNGVDMFDCVMPSRNARNGQLFTDDGVIVISNSRHRNSHEPISHECTCETCSGGFSRGYLAHLFRTKELLYHSLATVHNLHYYLSIVRRAREAIVNGTYEQFATSFIARYENADRSIN